MATFKDYLNSDIDQVFLNKNEFAGEITIDGLTIPVVFDEEQLQKYNLKADGEGLAKGELLFYAPVSAFNQKPFVRKRLRIDTKLYEISDLKENLGLYTIILVGYRS